MTTESYRYQNLGRISSKVDSSFSTFVACKVGNSDDQSDEILVMEGRGFSWAASLTVSQNLLYHFTLFFFVFFCFCVVILTEVVWAVRISARKFQQSVLV